MPILRGKVNARRRKLFETRAAIDKVGSYYAHLHPLANRPDLVTKIQSRMNPAVLSARKELGTAVLERQTGLRAGIRLAASPRAAIRLAFLKTRKRKPKPRTQPAYA